MTFPSPCFTTRAIISPRRHGVSLAATMHCRGRINASPQEQQHITCLQKYFDKAAPHLFALMPRPRTRQMSHSHWIVVGVLLNQSVVLVAPPPATDSKNAEFPKGQTQTRSLPSLACLAARKNAIFLLVLHALQYDVLWFCRDDCNRFRCSFLQQATNILRQHVNSYRLRK